MNAADRRRLFASCSLRSPDTSIAEKPRDRRQIEMGLAFLFGCQAFRTFMARRRGMGKAFSMAMPMQALDLIIVGVLWITILAATTDLLFVWAARIVTRWVPVEK